MTDKNIPFNPTFDQKQTFHKSLGSSWAGGKTPRNLREVLEISKRTGERFTNPAIRNHWIRVVDGSIECSDSTIKTLADLLICVLGTDTDWVYVPENRGQSCKAWAKQFLLAKSNATEDTNIFGLTI